MKKLSVCLILLTIATFTLAADDEADVIQQAQMDAKADGANYRATWWRIGGIVIPLVATGVAFSINGELVNWQQAFMIATPIMLEVSLALT
jgi:hypothetical protein